MIPADAARRTRELLDAHGLTDWRVAFNRAKRTAGSCNYATRTVTLSTFVLASRDDAANMNTITHEVAHALTKGHGHGYVWQRQHRAMGGDGRRCMAVEPVDHGAPWVAVCSAGTQHHRYRAPKPGMRFRCGCAPFVEPFSFVPNPLRSNA